MSQGTTPRGAETEEQAAAYVRGMFGRVAHRYDLLNHLLSFQIDRAWRRRVVQRSAPVLANPHARVLDLCCGTGDLMLALNHESKARVFGSDFCHPMLVAAARKSSREKAATPLFEADGLQLPLLDGSLDLITVAFGFRNFANYRKGLRELRRALKPGGTLAILEFSTPPNPGIAALYRFYSTKILPLVGGLVSVDRDAYTYLPESVRKFPNADQLAQDLREEGFDDVQFERMTFGIVALHTGRAGR
jgi:demethylmenaquinone methyltransferase/2-methoxy-6-polyprenyl-1,4-benzoquinol methylase